MRAIVHKQAGQASALHAIDHRGDSMFVVVDGNHHQWRERGTGIVVSCSALKRRYRDQLRRADPNLRFAHLQGPRGTIAARMQTRIGHYMPISLLDSQLRDLEPLQPDEAGITLDITQPPEALVASIIASINQ